MGIGGFLKSLGLGPKPKAAPLVIGSQSGPVPDAVLNARPQPGFVSTPRAAPVQTMDDGGTSVSVTSQPPSEEASAGFDDSTYVSDWLSAAEANELTVADAEGRPNLRLVWRGESLYFTVGDTGRFITASSRQLPRFDIWSFDARGTGYRLGHGSTEETGPLSKLKLVREPANEFDPNAIAIHSERGKILGYANKGNAKRMAKMLDNGTEFEVISLHGSPRGHESIGVTVLATSPEMMAWLLRDLN